MADFIGSGYHPVPDFTTLEGVPVFVHRQMPPTAILPSRRIEVYGDGVDAREFYCWGSKPCPVPLPPRIEEREKERTTTMVVVWNGMEFLAYGFGQGPRPGEWYLDLKGKVERRHEIGGSYTGVGRDGCFCLLREIGKEGKEGR